MTALDDLCTTPFHDAPDFLRARVLSRLADTEVFATLTAEPGNDRADLRILDHDGMRMAVACDREDRLSEFWGSAVAFAAMPGRVLAGLLAGQGVALLINPGQQSEMLLDPDSIAWLENALTMTPPGADATRLPRLGAPDPQVVGALLAPLSQRLADMAGLAWSAAFVGAQWPDGRQGHMLLLRGAAPDHQPAIAKALAELLAFLPPVAGGVDIAFVKSAPPSAAVLIELPESHTADAEPEPAPNRTEQPPRLR